MPTDEDIEVRRWGTEGPEIVVLHGGPGAPGSVAGLASLLAENFRVLEPLQRGSGSHPREVDSGTSHPVACVMSRVRCTSWTRR